MAGSVLPDRLNTLAIKGLQFTGQLLNENDPLASDASVLYHKKYPFAVTMKGDVKAIKLTAIKMTDNTLSFGKKIMWELDAVAALNA